MKTYTSQQINEVLDEVAADLIAVQSEDKLIQRGVVSSVDYNDFAEKRKTLIKQRAKRIFHLQD